MSRAETGACAIRVNQIGFRPGDRKRAFFTEYSERFEICRSDGTPVLNCMPFIRDGGSRPEVDSASGDTLWEGDFSELSQSGSYFILAGDARSPVFDVGEAVYKDLTAGILKMLYYQRCGGSGIGSGYIEEPFAHVACHTGIAEYYDPQDPVYGKVRADVSGGWHDAGDYGRYVSPAAKAVADLLLAAEHYPAIIGLDFGGPDKILGETRYEIEWMLKMQNAETGGVYHKVTTKAHANIGWLPEEDACQLYLAPVSAQATGDFAAVTAYAARFFRNLDPVFAGRCLDAAVQAWHWLAAHPEINAYVDPDFFRTGKYGDVNSLDERFWAAVELYNATRDREYRDYISENELPEFGFGWTNVGSYALASFLSFNGANTDEPLYTRMKNRFVSDTEKLLNIRRKNGYHVAVDRYVWGSNMDVANAAMHFILADRISPNPEYRAATMDQLDYLLGRNAMDLSYVTGFGEKAARHPHHRPSIIRDRAVPGMLVGGPFADISKLTRDPASSLFSEQTPPSKCYADRYESFSSNEICIYWNSPLAYILASLL